MGYLCVMIERKKNLFRQRIQYLRRGNFHGVSANWLAKHSDQLFSSVMDMALYKNLPIAIDSKLLSQGELVFEKILAEKSGTNYAKNFDCEIGLASFLHAYIVQFQPKVIVETGVANGITTNVIMHALAQVGGSLHSFDVDPKTENVYHGSGGWKFHLLTGELEKDLKRQVSEIGAVNLWIHDSNHGYQWQSFEYELAKKSLCRGGILVSDDIDSSTAWGLASKDSFDRSFGIFDNRKFFGVATF